MRAATARPTRRRWRKAAAGIGGVAAQPGREAQQLTHRDRLPARPEAADAGERDLDHRGAEDADEIGGRARRAAGGHRLGRQLQPVGDERSSRGCPCRRRSARRAGCGGWRRAAASACVSALVAPPSAPQAARIAAVEAARSRRTGRESRCRRSSPDLHERDGGDRAEPLEVERHVERVAVEADGHVELEAGGDRDAGGGGAAKVTIPVVASTDQPEACSTPPSAMRTRARHRLRDAARPGLRPGGVALDQLERGRRRRRPCRSAGRAATASPRAGRSGGPPSP